ncbi:hypothetical protein ACFQ7B_12220 [Streptomyces erythrochromogenes]|uniref:hypothetical protein n=1 Tax=Streptomyces erythrochromogenes TaxID=285574 RepID=UPI003695AFA9
MFNVPRSTVYGHLDREKTGPASRRRLLRRSLENYWRVTCCPVSELGLQGLVSGNTLQALPAGNRRHRDAEPPTKSRGVGT